MKQEGVKNRGITLIALIITIIVMLILVAVTISVALNGGLIGKAQDAKKQTEAAMANEQNIGTEKIEIDGTWYNSIDEYVKNTITEETAGWTQQGTTITNVNGQTLQVGQKINYNAGVESYEGGWKILGAENGKLLIMSDSDVDNLEGMDQIEAYNNGIKTLNEKCSGYANHVEGEESRSVKEEDLLRVLEFDPKTSVDGYGNKYVLTLKDGKVVYDRNGQEVTTTLTTLKHPDGRQLGVSGVNEIEICDYGYLWYDAAYGWSNKTDIASDLIFSSTYWLASTYETLPFFDNRYTVWGLRMVYAGEIATDGYVSWDNLFFTNAGVRAVVSLNSNVKLNFDEANSSWEIV